MTDTNRLLRLALLADAASSGAMGLLLAAGAGPLDPLLGLPAILLRPLGLALLPFAAFVAWVGTRETIRPIFVWTIVVVNAIWVLDSAALLMWPGVAPTGFGQLFVAAQAIAVGGLTVIQALTVAPSRNSSAALC